jgi:hypothetical protein
MSYPLLSPDSSDVAVKLVFQISQQLSAQASGTAANITYVNPETTFEIPQSAIILNSLWFFSLLLSLYSALAATLIQHCTRRYLRAVQQHGQPRKRGLLHVYLAQGIKRFGLSRAVETIVALLHTSVFLFIAGLLVLLFGRCQLVAWIVAGGSIAGSTAYLIISVFPLCAPDAPYRTPLTSLFCQIGTARLLRMTWVALYTVAFWLYLSFDALFVLLRAILWRWRPRSAILFLTRYSEAFSQFLRARAPFSIPHANVPPMEDSLLCALQSPDRMAYLALRETLKKVDENYEMEEFLVALSHFLRSNFIQNKHDVLYSLFTEDTLGQRMKQLLMTCSVDGGASNAFFPDSFARRVYILGNVCRELCPYFFQAAADRVYVPTFVPANRRPPALEWTDLLDVWDIDISSSVDPKVSLIAACARAQITMQILKLCPHTQRYWLHDPIHNPNVNHTKNFLDLTHSILSATNLAPKPLGEYSFIISPLLEELAACVSSRPPDKSSQIGAMLRRTLQCVLPGAELTFSPDDSPVQLDVETSQWVSFADALKQQPCALRALQSVANSIVP